MDLLAGVTKDEGPTLAITTIPQYFGNRTLIKEDFSSFVKITNGLFHNIDIKNITQFYMNGINDNDSEAIKRKFFDFFGDIAIKCPTYWFAKRYAQHSKHRENVFFYELTYTADKEIEKKLGVIHSSDVQFVFGHPLIASDRTVQNSILYTKQDIEFSKQIIKYWTNFAKYGLEL